MKYNVILNLYKKLENEMKINSSIVYFVTKYVFNRNTVGKHFDNKDVF